MYNEVTDTPLTERSSIIKLQIKEQRDFHIEKKEKTEYVCM